MSDTDRGNGDSNGVLGDPDPDDSSVMSSGEVFYVYLVECSDGSLYTGQTNDIARRLHEHNNTTKAARYTRRRRPVELVHVETYASRGAAMAREDRIKDLTRPAKEVLVNSSPGPSVS